MPFLMLIKPLPMLPDVPGAGATFDLEKWTYIHTGTSKVRAGLGG